MKNPIAIYLHDHLAGATCALDLVDRIHKNVADKEVGRFAARLREEIAADKETLHSLASQFGPTSDVLKDSVAWLSEKISRIKLSHDDGTGLGLFEALEFLALGIHGKLALWTALAEVADRYTSLTAVDFDSLRDRAHQQEQATERFRLIAARAVFNNSPLAANNSHS
jgi:hypothetical protein